MKPESEVWRVEGPGGVAYVKIVDDPEEAAVEAERLKWLDHRSAVATPSVLGMATDEVGRQWLVTTEVRGTPSHDRLLLIPDAAAMVDAVGFGLRRFHDSLDVSDCPFHHRVTDLVAGAEARVARGGVDPSTMSATYRRHSSHRLLDHLIATCPDEPDDDLVVAHGDPCQPNLLLDPNLPAEQSLCGLVDMGRVGVSDRYRDLAIIVRSLLMNLDAETIPRFFDAYGLSNPDPLRPEWYVLVDNMW